MGFSALVKLTLESFFSPLSTIPGYNKKLAFCSLKEDLQQNPAMLVP